MNPLADRCQWLTCRRHFSISVKFDSNASHRWRWQRRSFQGAPARRYRINYRYIRGEGRGGGGGKEKDNKYRLLEPTLGVFKWPCSGGLEKGKEELGTCSLILLCRGIHQVLLFGRPSTTARPPPLPPHIQLGERGIFPSDLGVSIYKLSIDYCR